MFVTCGTCDVEVELVTLARETPGLRGHRTVGLGGTLEPSWDIDGRTHEAACPMCGAAYVIPTRELSVPTAEAA